MINNWIHITKFLIGLATIILSHDTFCQNITSDFPKNNTTGFSQYLSSKQLKKANKQQRKQWNRGYLDFSIDSSNAKQGVLSFNKGRKYYWGDITFTQDSAPIKKPKGKFSVQNYRSFNGQITEYYSNAGFPSHYYSSQTRINDNQLDLTYTINKGNLVLFDTLKLTDSIIKSRSYLQNLLQIKPNLSYDKSKIESIERVINGSEIFIYESHELSFSNDKALVSVQTTEIKSNTFSGFIGLQPNSSNKTTITGQINLDLKNVLKQGELLQFKWQKNTPESQLLDSRIKFPFLLNSPIGTNASIFIDQQDSTFTNTKLQGGLSFYLRQSMFSSIESRYVKSTQNYKMDYPSSSTSLMLGLTFNSNQLNNPINPNKGFSIDLESFAGKREINQETLHSVVRVDYKIDLRYFIPIARHTLLLRNKFAGIQSDSLQTNEFLRIGGIQNLRGFDENIIFTNQFNLFTVEYRYLLDKQSNIFTFCDYAISQEYLDTNLTFVNRIGFGVGLNINTRAGLLSLAYALGKEQFQPININQSKIHIGYLARF